MNTKKSSSIFNPLDDEEEALAKILESGDFESIPNLETEKKRMRQIAKNTAKKDARVNIRLSSVDLLSIKARAAYEGIPYQTLIASILHKYAAGHFQAHAQERSDH